MNVKQTRSSAELQAAYEASRADLKLLIVTMAQHNIVPEWIAELLMKWQRLEDA